MWTVTAQLAESDFTAADGTLLSNYNLPTTAQGEGEITLAIPHLPDCVTSPDGVCLTLKLAYAIGNPRSFIPDPSETGLYLGRTNGFGDLGMIVTPDTTVQTSSSETVSSGAPVLNSTDQVLIQGDRDKRWTIRFEPRPTAISLGGQRP